MTTAEDEELLHAWRAGDLRAGKQLVERYHSKIVRFFINKVGRLQAEELTQETFLAVQEGLARFRGESNFRSWLFGIARLRLLKHHHHQSRDQRRFDPEASSQPDIVRSPASVLEAEHHQRLLLSALRRLQVDDQIMLELHYWDELSIAEIAEVVGKPINTVKTRMRRGRLRLDELMAEMAESTEQLDETRSGLQGWAARIRNEVGSDSDDGE